MPSTGPDRIAGIPSRTGHFVFESGHHGDLWLDLDALFAHPEVTEEAARELSNLLHSFAIDVVCGAMTGGALLAQVVARQLGLKFTYTDRHILDGHPVYLLSPGQQLVLAGKRVALIDDVINGGSATCGTYNAVVEAGGIPVAVGALLILGNAIDQFATDWNLPVLSRERRQTNLWDPLDCPLCRHDISLSVLDQSA